MKEILNIINKNLGPENFNKKSFTGKVFFQNKYGLNIERSVHNRLFTKYNVAFDFEEGDLLTTDNNLLLVFINEIFVDKSSSGLQRDRKLYLSTVLDESGLLSIFSELGEESILFTQSWEDIDLVELFEAESGGYLFRFYVEDKTEQVDLLSNRFGTSSLVASKKILNIFNEIIDYKRQVILRSKIDDLISDENYQEALKELEVYKNTYDVEDISNDNTSYYHFNKTLTLIQLDQYEEALNIIDNHIKKFEEINEISAYAYEIKGRILLKMNNFLSAVNCLAISEENYDEVLYKEDALALKQKSYSKLKEFFLEVPYNERKLIFIAENIYATKSREIVVLKKNDLPLNVHFLVSHPNINEVYICHPHKQDFYLSLKSYSEELFKDRVFEFRWLLQCLGATELEITSSTSDLSDQTVRSKTEADAKIDYKLLGAKVNYQGENTANALIDGKFNIATKQLFKPTKLPFIPDNLVWYHSDTSWRRLAHQRLNGSIMMHSELISSSQSETISTHELKQVEAELKLLFPKIGVTYNSEEEVIISSLKKYEWMVNVEFADVNDLLQFEPDARLKPADLLNSDSKKYRLALGKYKEDVLFMLEDDGVIDEYKRNLLNRKIKKYGLTEEDARAIENELIRSCYSENELNYIQELKELLEVGEISDIERKILDRYAIKFNVTADVQKKIDTIYII